MARPGWQIETRPPRGRVNRRGRQKEDPRVTDCEEKHRWRRRHEQNVQRQDVEKCELMGQPGKTHQPGQRIEKGLDPAAALVRHQ